LAPVDVELAIAQRSDASEIAHLALDLVEIGLGCTYRPDPIRTLIRNTHTVRRRAWEGRRSVRLALTIKEFARERMA
jgi:hypothetical protein